MSTYGVCVILQTGHKKMKNNRIKGILFPYVLKTKSKQITLQKHTSCKSIADKALNGGKSQGHICFTVSPITVKKNVVKEIERGENPVIVLIDFYH